MVRKSALILIILLIPVMCFGAVADELRKAFTSDGTRYNLGIQTRQVSSNDAEGLASWFTEKKPAAKPSAHRSAVTTADTGDISSPTGNLDVGNSQYVACFIDFDDPSINATIALALFDNAGTPDFIGITEIAAFGSDSSWRDGAAGPYVSQPHIFPTYGASKVRAVVKSLTGGGSINIFLIPL